LKVYGLKALNKWKVDEHSKHKIPDIKNTAIGSLVILLFIFKELFGKCW